MSASLVDEKIAIDKGPGSDAPSFSDESIENPMGINEKRLLRKLDYKLLPGLTLLYLLSFLDRSNSMSPGSTLIPHHLRAFFGF
jgi:hypothetical protein